MQRPVPRKAHRGLDAHDGARPARDPPALRWLAFAVTGSAPRIAQADLAALTASPHTAKIAAQLAPLAAGPQDDPNATLAMNTGASTGNSTGDNANTDAAAVTVTLLNWRLAGMYSGRRSAPRAYRPESITVIGVDGDPAPDFLRLNLGTEFLAVLASIALIGTTVLLVPRHASAGMLRLLGTTPSRAACFLRRASPCAWKQLLLACTAGFIAIGIARRYTEVSALPRFAVTVSCAAIMLFGLGAVFSARARNAEASQNAHGWTLACARVQRGRGNPDRRAAGSDAHGGRPPPRQLGDGTGKRGPRWHDPVAAGARVLGAHAPHGSRRFVIAAARRFSWDAAPTPARRRKDPEAHSRRPI